VSNIERIFATKLALFSSPNARLPIVRASTQYVIPDEIEHVCQKLVAPILFGALVADVSDAMLV
jgi:hypothetical protein